MGASDGHSVTSYRQRPTTLTLNPEQAGNTSVGTCQLFTVNVLDQSNQPIAGANVDVHAQGPDEAVKFDVGAEFTDENQPPDQNHTSTEPGVACAEDGSSAEAGEADTQGTDPVAGEPSRKHVESVVGSDDVDGTDNEGNWTFALHSAANGNTQVAAWADFDEDDQHCADEAQDHSSIGWGVPAPAVAPQPAQVEECVVDDPSPSPTASPTDASPSPTDSPSPSVSPSPDPEPNMWSRTITIGFKHPKNNNKLRVKGRVKAEAGAPKQCTAGTTVKIQKKVKGNWKGRGKTQTNGKGFYKRNVKDTTGRYRATAVRTQVSDTDTCTNTRRAKNHKHR